MDIYEEQMARDLHHVGGAAEEFYAETQAMQRCIDRQIGELSDYGLAVDGAKRIEYDDGSLVQKFDGKWYAYPKVDDLPGDGGAVLTEVGEPAGDGLVWNKPKVFKTAGDARMACLGAIQRAKTKG